MAEEFLVLGATGKTGRRVVAGLRALGKSVRAASRSGEVRFDWYDKETWESAVRGATALYLVAPDDPSPVDPFVGQAVAAGVDRFVVLSARGLDQMPPTSFQGMAAAERAVRATGARWTVLRPNNFNQNFDEYTWREPLREGRLGLPIGGVGDPFIDVRDIADVAVAALTEDGHHGAAYDLSGPRALTFAEAIAVISLASGRPIRYDELTPAQYRAELLVGGVPEETADELNALFAHMRTGRHAAPGDGVQRVLGRDPIAFEDYAEAAADAWR